MSSPKARGEQQRVVVEPVDAALGLGQDEAVRARTAACEVEFSQHHGVAAATGEAQMARSCGLGRSCRRPARPSPRPPPAPGRRGRAAPPSPAVGHGSLQRGAPPEAARLCRVLPEIVQESAAPGDEGQLVRPVERRLDRIPVGLEAGIGEPRPGWRRSAPRPRRGRVRPPPPRARARDRRRGRRGSGADRRGWT